MFWLMVLISGILYRVPRGGGLGEGRSLEGSAIWAGVTGLGFALIFWSFWPLVIVPLLILGEAPGWSKWWPNRPDGGSMVRLSLRGCLLLNPLMGPIYFEMYHHREKLPSLPGLGGWSEWSELACGIVTATAYGVVLCFLLT